MRASRLRPAAALLAALVFGCGGSADEAPAPAASRPTASGAWQQRAALPTPRSEVASAVLAGRIYVIGGYLAAGGASDVVEAYDPEADGWQRLAPLPARRDHAMAAALDGELYVFGGNAGAEVSTVFAYNPASDSWTRKRDMPFRRAAGGAAALAGKIVVAGGTGDQPAVTMVYDPATDGWSLGRPLSAPREHLAIAEAGGRVYLIGGRWQGTLLALNEVLTDPLGDWARLAPMPTARGGTAGASLDGLIYVAGGEAFGPSRTFAEVEIYDPATNRWSTAPDLPTPRHGLAVQGIAGLLFVIGGGPQAGLSVAPENEALRPP